MRARLVCAGVLPEKPKSLYTYRIYSLNDEPSQKFARGLFKNGKKKITSTVQLGTNLSQANQLQFPGYLSKKWHSWNWPWGTLVFHLSL